MFEKLFRWLLPWLHGRLERIAALEDSLESLHADMEREHVATKALLRSMAEVYESQKILTWTAEEIYEHGKTLEMLEREALKCLPLSDTAKDFPTAIQRGDRAWPRKLHEV